MQQKRHFRFTRNSGVGRSLKRVQQEGKEEVKRYEDTRIGLDHRTAAEDRDWITKRPKNVIS